MQVNFKHIKYSANNLADFLAKKGTERDIPLLLCKVCWFFVTFFKGFGTRLLYFPLLVWLLFYLVLFQYIFVTNKKKNSMGKNYQMDLKFYTWISHI